MSRKPISNALTRSYEDFMPISSVQQDASHETLVINLPEFKKEQVRVQIDSFGNLKITGERPLLGSVHNKWSRFRKDYRIPSNCNPNEIRAKFENGVLNVIMPIPTPKQEAPPAAPATTPSPTQPATETNLPSPAATSNPITDPIHALFQQMKDKLPASSTPQAPSTSSKPTPTQPAQKPATESKLPSPAPLPNPITDPIHALLQQMKDKLPTSTTPQAPSTSSKPTSTQPAQKPATESKLPSPAPVQNPISDPIHALFQQMKDKFHTPIPQAPATSSNPTATTPTKPSHGPATDFRVSPVPHPTPVVQPTQKESAPTPTKVPEQQSHQYHTTNDDKTTHIPQSPPSQVSSTPIPEITHRKKPADGESSSNKNNAAQRTQEFEKIAKEKEEKKSKYVDAAQEIKGNKSSSKKHDHGDSSGHGCTLETYIEGLAMELKKPTTQLVVNMVVASMVVVGLITWTIKSTKRA